jgi:hypothetical protein|tara:strand:+ start:1337 stop:1633 length:297 start_codon:yes stop_codon:yes gene_type:complete
MNNLTSLYGVYLDIENQEVTSMVIAAVTAYLKSQKILYKIDYQKGDVCKVKRVVYIMESTTNLQRSVCKDLRLIFPQLEIIEDDIMLHSELEEGTYAV